MSSRTSFRGQVGMDGKRGSRESTLMPKSEQDRLILAAEIGDATDIAAAAFKSKFSPPDMRQLALVAHNHMKPAMKDFIETYSEILKKFRITGTQTTMRMCKTMWGEDNPDIEYGLTCTSGPLGGDAQIAALMCMEDLGALIFFVDPLSAHPHQADIDSLIRLANCGNVIVCPNPTSAMSMMHTLKSALETGNRGMIPSFFETLESPAVEEYKFQQEVALAAAVSGKPQKGGAGRPILGAIDQSMHFDGIDQSMHFDNIDHSEHDSDFDEDEAADAVSKMRVSVASGNSRASTLAGMNLKSNRKKKRGLIKQIKSSMKRLNLKEMK
ncbi:hypothetical protein ACHAXR_009843 [Thalassiosira sp. AJA248-18]